MSDLLQHALPVLGRQQLASAGGCVGQRRRFGVSFLRVGNALNLEQSQ